MALSAREIAVLYKSPRYLRLERLEQYVEGTQYQGRTPWLSEDPKAAPLLEREPCINDPIVKDAIGDMVDFMCGQDRFPYLSTSDGDGDDEDLDDDWGLAEDESERLERWTNGALSKTAMLRHHLPEALRTAMRGSSVAVLACIRDGLPAIIAFPAKWCTPTLNTSGKCTRLVITYPYIVEERDPLDYKRWIEVCYVYRRVIDDQSDTVYLPALGREDGHEPNWQPDLTQTVVHGLGFCPVHWYAFDRSTDHAGHIDGHAVHKYLTDEVDALNFSLSQRHRAALYTGDPQIYETGVGGMTQPAPGGRPARSMMAIGAGTPGQSPIGTWNVGGSQGSTSRKKGPGVVWRYPEPESKVGMLALPAGALDGITLNSDDIRKKIVEALGVVIVDPNNAKTFGALSGKAMAFMFARMIARADAIRMEAGNNLFLPVIDMLLRLCHAVGKSNPRGLRIPGIRKVLPILAKFEQAEEYNTPALDGTITKAQRAAWFGPRLELEWGAYFQASAEEENFLISMCVAAYSAGLMPLDVIVEKLRSVFSFGSAEELIAKIEEEKARKQQEAVEQMKVQASIAGAVAPPGPKPPPKAGSGNGAKGDKKG